MRGGPPKTGSKSSTASSTVREALEALLEARPDIRDHSGPVCDPKGKVRVRVTVPVPNGWKAIALSA